MEKQYESLEFYLNLAKKMVTKFSPSFIRKELLNSDESISEIAEAIMTADWRWDPDRSGHNGQKKTNYSYRNQCGIWAIKTIITKKYKNKTNNTISLNEKLTKDIEKDILSVFISDKNDDPAKIAENLEEKNNIKQYISDIFNSDILSDKQKIQIYDYYINDRTLAEIGLEHGVTREAIRQNIQKGINKIKNLCTK
jgi:RNA polymerase sigma factor (sigma-70 family)